MHAISTITVLAALTTGIAAEGRGKFEAFTDYQCLAQFDPITDVQLPDDDSVHQFPPRTDAIDVGEATEGCTIRYYGNDKGKELGSVETGSEGCQELPAGTVSYALDCGQSDEGGDDGDDEGGDGQENGGILGGILG